MTDLYGRTVVLTGATSGIGAAAATAFARRGAHILVVGRDQTRGAAVVRELARVGGTGEFLAADLLSLSDVTRLAETVLARTPVLDALINNAGGMFRTKQLSADGIEATFALNTVAPFALAHYLQGALALGRGRVVNITTGFLGRTRLAVDDLVNPTAYSGLGSYTHAKLASIMLTMEQAERWKAAGIRAIAVQPGIVPGTRFGGADPTRSSTARSMSGPLLRLLGLGATLDQAVERYRRAAFGDLPSGTYFAWGKVAPLPRQAQEQAVRHAVWDLLERIIRP